MERYVEERVETGLRQWLRAPLQPVEVAKAAARAMEESQAIGASGPQVANRYDIRLHPHDFDRFASFRLALLRDVERYLDDEAERQGLRPVDAWQVSMETDDKVRPGRVNVEAGMADVIASASGDSDQSQMTTVLRRPQPSAPPSVALLIIEDHEYPLSGTLTTIGRALDNHIVLSDTRVSRYHAHIEHQGDRYRIRDLASTNGTSVRGRRITETTLAPGDEISLGGLMGIFQVRTS